MLGIIGASPNQVPLVQEALAMRLPVVTIDGASARIGHELVGVEPLVVDLKDRDAVLAGCLSRGVTKLATLGSDLGLYAFCHCADALGLPNRLPAPALALSMDKRRQRDALKEADVCTPLWSWWGRGEPPPAMAIRTWTGRRLVVKPADRWGALGTTVLRALPDSDDRAFREAGHRALAVSELAGVIVEEFIEGTEFSLTLELCDGLVETAVALEKLKLPGRWKARGLFPRHLHRIDRQSVDIDVPTWCRSVVAGLRRIVSGLAPGWTGLVNADVVVDNDRPVVLEFTFRGPGNGATLAADRYFATSFTRRVIDAACRTPSTWTETRGPLEHALGARPDMGCRREVPLTLSAAEGVRMLSRLRSRLSTLPGAAMEAVFMDPPRRPDASPEPIGPTVGGCLMVLSVPLATSPVDLVAWLASQLTQAAE